MNFRYMTVWQFSPYSQLVEGRKPGFTTMVCILVYNLAMLNTLFRTWDMTIGFWDCMHLPVLTVRAHGPPGAHPLLPNEGYTIFVALQTRNPNMAKEFQQLEKMAEGVG